MLRYAFDAPLAGPSPIENAPTAPFDAAVETWWDKKNSAADWVVSRAFVEQWLPADDSSCWLRVRRRSAASLR